MASENQKFLISFVGSDAATAEIEKDAIMIGRLATCDVVLDHTAVSRIHAGINYLNGKFFLINLSGSNVLTINGRLLASKKTDVLADRDVLQIGPFVITIKHNGEELHLDVQEQSTANLKSTAPLPSAEVLAGGRMKQEEAGVLKVFWEKRSREKDDWGTRLRPTKKPVPGKAAVNWMPTRDLRRPWRIGVFVWAILVFGTLAAFAYIKYPESYAPKPLANPHQAVEENTLIAARPNANSCTTCHQPGASIESACITCHAGEQFHSSNTKAHEDAKVTCTACHREHQGAEFDLKASAIRSCAQCHNDANKALYNGKSVRTPHSGSYGYPVEAGDWKWRGVYREVAAAIPEISSSATGDASERERISRHFHTVHVGRLKVASGMKGDKNGLVSCSTCHNSFDPVDRETPRQTCAACHTTQAGATDRDARFATGQANCISCHVQHPYSAKRWSEFLTDDAVERRRVAVSQQISALKPQ
jgi:predicted CXXCH cytochrome family protein